MKKSLLLLVFVACALFANAMSGPIKSIDLLKLSADWEVVIPTPEASCLVCTTCGNLTLCAYGKDCVTAGNLLSDLMTERDCGTSGN